MFKFVRVSEIETIDKLIGDNPTIKFCSAFNLNDPYELKFNLKINPYSKRSKTEYFDINPKSSMEEFKIWQEQVSGNSIWYLEQKQRLTVGQMVTIASFAGNNENNLMWSHYTDNHQGICIEYQPSLLDFLKKEEGFLASGKVKYSKIPPTVDSSDSFERTIIKMVFNKQTEWRYEEEFRIVFQSKNDTDFLPIDSKLIKAVYIGSKAPSDIVKCVVETCKRNNIAIWYAITLGKTYKVTFKQHDDKKIYTRTFWK